MSEAKLKDLSKVSVIGTAASVAAATAESIASNIREAILEHRLAPGAKLTEAQLCEVFDVKRGTVRLALAQLAGERLVDLEPNRGAFVASPSVQEVHEVFEMRRIIEMAVVGGIWKRRGTRPLKEIGAAIRLQRQGPQNPHFASPRRPAAE